MKQAIQVFFIYFLALGISNAQNDLFVGERGTVDFKSEAPLELIEAKSHTLKGIINPATNAFAVTVGISSFQGFNSDIQRTHFMENYMEQKQFPQVTFTGKLIEEIPFNVPGSYSVRAKGMLNIHGVAKERIIRGTLTIKNGVAHIQTNFSIPLADHGITVPKIVKQKIAELISVTVDLELLQGSKS